MYQDFKKPRNQETKKPRSYKPSPMADIRHYYMLTILDSAGDVIDTKFCEPCDLGKYTIDIEHGAGRKQYLTVMLYDIMNGVQGGFKAESQKDLLVMYEAAVNYQLTGICFRYYHQDGGQTICSRMDSTDALRWHQLVAWAEFKTGHTPNKVERSMYHTLLEQCLMAKVVQADTVVKRHIINDFDELMALAGATMRVTLNQWRQVLETRTTPQALDYITGSYSMRASDSGKMYAIAKGQRVVSDWHQVGRLSPFAFRGREGWRESYTDHKTGAVTFNFLARIDAGNGWEVILTYPTPEQLKNPFYTFSLL